MSWNTLFTQDSKPNCLDFSKYVNCNLWDELCEYIENVYKVTPNIEYSRCSMEPGWNIKFKKSGRSLCTLYPKQNYFTCMISVGTREVMETEFILPSFEVYLQELYKNTNTFNGARWLMIDVTTNEILENVKILINIRGKLKKG